MTRTNLFRTLVLVILTIGLQLGGCGGGGGGGGTTAGAPNPGLPGGPPEITPGTTPTTLDPIQIGTQGGSPSAAFSIAVGINDANQVIGFAETAAGSSLRAALWSVNADGSASSAPQALKPLGSNSFSAAFAIDAAGNVVGQSADALSLVAVLWRPGVAEPERLPALATGADSAAFGISPDGHLIVGEAEDATFQTRAVAWEVVGGVIGAPTLLSEALPAPAAPGSYAGANGVSDDGWIAGVVEDTEGREHGVLWRPDGTGGYTLTDLRRGGEVSSEAIAVNLAGEVVGISEPTAGALVPALWTADAQGEFKRTDLAAEGGAVAINANGRVAGWESATPLATVWDNAAPFNLLATPSQAYGLNNSGLVVGAEGATGFVIQAN